MSSRIYHIFFLVFALGIVSGCAMDRFTSKYAGYTVVSKQTSMEIWDTSIWLSSCVTPLGVVRCQVRSVGPIADPGFNACTMSCDHKNGDRWDKREVGTTKQSYPKYTVMLRSPAGQVVRDEVASLVFENIREGQVIQTSSSKAAAAQPLSSMIAPKDTQAVDVPSSPSTSGHLVVIKAANVRAAANNKSKIITTLKKGAKVENLGNSGNWFNVKLSSGLTGWVFKDLVKKAK